MQLGYAASITDTGHDGRSASFALGHPEKLIDWGYRAAHEMAVKSKAIMAAYYGAGPKLSYWKGCSAGGRQGLKEAQRYPEDFNGIVSGSPGINWTGGASGMDRPGDSQGRGIYHSTRQVPHYSQRGARSLGRSEDREKCPLRRDIASFRVI